MSKGTIIFDFDGTIADSFEFVSRFIAERGGQPRWKLAERRRQFAGLTMRGMAEKLSIPLGRQLWLFFYGRRLMAKHITEIKPFEAIEAAISSLHAQGYELYALSSNRKENIELFLKQYGLGRYFSGMQGNASVFGKKLALRSLLWRHSLKTADCFYVGDEAGDLRASQRVHIHSIAVTWGYNDASILKTEKPFAVAEKPADLIKIFANK